MEEYREDREQYYLAMMKEISELRSKYDLHMRVEQFLDKND